jgi:hypothetical protein
VRALKSKHNLPVEAEHQQDLVRLLSTIYARSGTLQQGLADLQWAGQVAEDGTAWEGRLMPLSDAVTTCSQYMHAWEGQREALVAINNKTGVRL